MCFDQLSQGIVSNDHQKRQTMLHRQLRRLHEAPQIFALELVLWYGTSSEVWLLLTREKLDHMEYERFVDEAKEAKGRVVQTELALILPRFAKPIQRTESFFEQVLEIKNRLYMICRITSLEKAMNFIPGYMEALKLDVCWFTPVWIK